MSEKRHVGYKAYYYERSASTSLPVLVAPYSGREYSTSLMPANGKPGRTLRLRGGRIDMCYRGFHAFTTLDAAKRWAEARNSYGHIRIFEVELWGDVKLAHPDLPTLYRADPLRQKMVGRNMRLIREVYDELSRRAL